MIDFLATPLDTDLAYRWIQALFPTDASQPYGQAFAIFTSALTFLGALFMGWHIMIGIVTSAYSGKVLGERYHQIWAPLRVVLGFGMLVPIAGGFSSVHYLLRDVVGVAAIQMANIPIVTYINGMATNPPGISPAAMQGKNAAERVLNLQACAAIVEGINTVAAPWAWNRATATIMPTATPYSATLGLGSSGYKWSYGDCGTLFLETPEPEGEFADDAASRIQAFVDKRRDATDQLMRDLQPLIKHAKFGEYFATKAFDPEKPMGAAHAKELISETVIASDIVDQIDRASKKWNDAVSEAAKEVFADSSIKARAALMERIAKYGFMVAGSYERSLSQLSAMAASFSSADPRSTIGVPGKSYEAAFLGAEAALKAARQIETRDAGISAGASPDDGAAEMEAVMSALAPMLQTPNLEPDDPDPIGSMISFGHQLLAGAQAAILTMGILKGSAQGLADAITGLAGGGILLGFLSWMGQWIGYAIMIALIVGLMHAYVLPMIPMIMVFVMGVSWLVLFLEAAIAGVLWAFAFIRMDGQEFFDRNQAPGVTLLFNLFLRPAIGMLAFIGGLIMMPVLLNGLAVIWNDSFSTQTKGMMVNDYGIGWAALIVMHCWMQWHLYLRVWGLVPTIADRVGHWMGFQMHGYNDGQETQAATGAMIAAGAAMTKAPLMPQGGGRKTPTKQEVNDISGNKPNPGRSKSTTPRR